MPKWLSMLLFIVLILGVESAQAQARIRVNMGGAKLTAAGTTLSISITVDTLTPTVAVGTAADQSFRDDSVGAAFFGYYLSIGARTQGQAAGTLGYVMIKAGVGETAGRTYYLLGNGTTVPTVQSNLTDAPATNTAIDTFPRNSTACGTNFVANGIDNVNGINCTTANDDPNMDVTVFTKVLFTDPPSTVIHGSIEVTIVEQ